MDKPEYGKQYALTGGTGTKSIANGDSWKDSEVKPATKHYKLIVNGDSSFSLSNETDADVQSDYFPGIWSISSQKSALYFAKDYLAKGYTITVTDYDRPQYHALANKFIRELNLPQPLFKEMEEIQRVPTGNKPANLSQLKKYLIVGRKIKIGNFRGAELVERETIVLGVQTASVILEKIAGTGTKSWLELGKATEWAFTDKQATKYWIDHEGKREPSTVITYLD